MQIYLPIADLPVNIFLVLAMGLAVGFISGMFGIGGGFLMTPLLIFIGISPAVAVASVASHIAASSCSGAISYWRRRAVDLALGLMLLAGGILGTAVGVWLFTLLRSLGQLDLTIGISYVVLLCTVGGLMVSESVRAILRAAAGQAGDAAARQRTHLGPRAAVQDAVQALEDLCLGHPGLADRLPHRLRRRVMGIGGGFLLVPMLIYLLRVPTATVIGTSMVLTLVTMASATVMHAATNHLVDAVLALILMVGGVIGAQFGARAGQNMRGERLRLLLGLLVLAVGMRFAFQLVVQPDDLYSIRCWVPNDATPRHRRRCALAVPIAAPTPAAAERLVTSISRHQVLVNSNFTGTSIVLFGTVEPDTQTARRRAAGYDLVVTVTGPKQTIVERRKERVLGIWTNIGSRTFVNAPSYLAVLSNQPLEQSPTPRRCGSCSSASDNLLPQHIRGDIADVVPRRSVPRKLPPDEVETSSTREAERRDVPDADAVPRGDSAAGGSADRHLRGRRQAVRRRRAARAPDPPRNRQGRLRAVRRHRRARLRIALRLRHRDDGAPHRLVRRRGVPAGLEDRVEIPQRSRPCVLFRRNTGGTGQ